MKAKTEATAPTATANATAVATTTDATVGYADAARYHDVRGDIDSDDLIIPRLALTQKSGNLSDEFPLGSWVLNKSAVVAELGQKFRITPLIADKFYQENVEYGGDQMPRRFDNHYQAEAVGLRTKKDPETGEKPEISKCLDLTVLIRGESEDLPPEFNLEFEGELFALALWSMTSWSAYQNAARWILTARQMRLPSLHAAEWEVTSEKSQMANGNTFFIPKVRQSVNNSAEFKTWADQLMAG